MGVCIVVLQAIFMEWTGLDLSAPCNKCVHLVPDWKLREMGI
jgi:hypothetical protein